MLELLWVLVQFNWLVPRISNWSLEASTHFTRRILFKRPGGHEHWGFVKKKIWKHCQQTLWKSMFHQNSYCKELSHRSSESFPCPGAGSGEREGLAHSRQGANRSSPTLALPAPLPTWVVAAQSAPAPATQAPVLWQQWWPKSESCSKDRISQELEGECKGDSKIESYIQVEPLPQVQCLPAQEEKEDKHEKEDKQDWVQPSGEPGCRQQWVCIRISGSGADSTPGIKLRA